MALVYVQILTAWLVILCIFCGFGLCVLRLLKTNIKWHSVDLSVFWFGFAAIIGFLQFWHLFLRIDGWTVIIISILSLTGIVLHQNVLITLLKKKWKHILFGIVPLITIISVWVANRSLDPRLGYDTGLYHWTAIKWISEYPIIFGLGNLHERLAFNNSYFLYGALLNNGIWEGKIQHIMAGILFIVIAGQSIVSIWQRFFLKNNYRFYHYFNILIIYPVFIYVSRVSYPAISNPSPDIAIYVISVVLTSHLCRFIDKIINGETDYKLDRIYITALAALGITVKLSFICFGALSVLIIFIGTIWREHENGLKRFFTDTVSALAMGAFLIGTWMFRGILLSGYVAFPSTILSLPVSWKVPEVLVLETANTIRGWGRQRGMHWIDTFYNNDWIIPTINRIPWNLVITGIISFVFLFVIFGRTKAMWLKSLVLLPICASILFWFFSAPDLRFSTPLFDLLAVLPISMAISMVEFGNITIIVCLLAYFFIAYSYIFSPPITFSNHLWRRNTKGITNIPKVEYKTKLTKSDLKIHQPAIGDKGYDIPLPNTPYFRPFLRTRGDNNDIRSGFILDKFFWGNKGRQIEGFDISSDLLFKLQGNWVRLKEKNDSMILKKSGKLLIYSKKACNTVLSFNVGRMNINGKYLNGKKEKYESGKANIEISNNGSLAHSLSIQSGNSYDIPINFHKNFNLISIDISKIDLGRISENTQLMDKGKNRIFTQKEFKKIKKLSGLSRSQMANHLRIERQIVFDILKGKKKVSQDISDKLRKVFPSITMPMAIEFISPITVSTI